ncbi:hypothetical protein BHE74_00036324 [Ensete ventricosum]|nr:hypothetical protein BHE74_00036324 [Ensete ventricosum]
MHWVDAVGNLPGVRRELAEGIGSLLGWRKGVRQKKNETCQKIVGGSRKACREFTKGIGKLTGNTSGDRQKKTKRLTARMPKVAGLAGGRPVNHSYPGVRAVEPPRSAGKSPIPSFSRVTGRTIVLRGEIKSHVNPVRVELIGDRSAVVNLSFWKVSSQAAAKADRPWLGCLQGWPVAAKAHTRATTSGRGRLRPRAPMEVTLVGQVATRGGVAR